MTCGDCACFMSDVDEEGNPCEFHHAEGQYEALCIMKDLFTNSHADDPACEDFIKAVKNE